MMNYCNSKSKDSILHRTRSLKVLNLLDIIFERESRDFFPELYIKYILSSKFEQLVVTVREFGRNSQ